MKSKELVIQINKPVAEVFAFVIKPANTPRWIDFIVKEETNESPPKLGTIYRNQNSSGRWSEYEMTVFAQDKKFTMSNHKAGYHVNYVLKPVGKGRTELTYFEWIDKGELEEPFTIDILEKLKKTVEKE